MVDFYWLKSFTEILQLFISVFFIIYLKVKYDRPTIPLIWLTTFFYIKLGTDLYGILNYTSWISTILTKPILSLYRTSMGALEVGMLTSFLLFSWSLQGKQIALKKGLPYFSIAILFFPLSLLLQVYFNSNLLEMFELVKVLWIGSILYLLKSQIKEKYLKLFAWSILVWNLIWLAEVVLHQHLHFITEDLSWVMFVLAELILTISVVCYLIQVIAKPKILKYEKLSDVLPDSLQVIIKRKLEEALEENKAFRDPELTANKLANLIDIAPPDLTLYLNRIINKNFNQLLIDFRIEESSLLLSDPESQNLTIEQIMYSVGFSSKSVFNTAFKKMKGKTPSEFRKLTEEKNGE